MPDADKVYGGLAYRHKKTYLELQEQVSYPTGIQKLG